MTVEYKDFFEVTDHLPVDNVDYRYGKVVVSERSVFKEDGSDLVTFEKLDADKGIRYKKLFTI